MPGNSIFIRLIDYRAGALTSAGTIDTNIAILNREVIDPKNPQFIQVMAYSSDILQTLNIGSQSTGAGAGKVTFNPFSITKISDSISPTLYQNCASGTPDKTVEVFLANSQNFVFTKYTYKLVAVKTIAWSASAGDGSLIESVSFDYGGLFLTINQQSPDGKTITPVQFGWNRVRNVRDSDIGSLIQ